MRPDELMYAIKRFGVFRHPPEGSVLVNPLFLEFMFWAVVVLVAVGLLIIRPRLLDRIELRLKQVSRHRMATVVGVGVLALALRATLLPWLPYPTPAIHDEFSYILQAKTFATGRVTNPPHPLWVHFETFHVNMRPTYESMYPPAQAAFMAVAQLLTHQPWWGVWLSAGLMCACITWMLQAWMPPQWALLGGLFCVLRFDIFSYWVNSYWGGAVAATGGALVLGAIPRLMRKRTTANAVLLVLGLIILANSRPYEGFVFAVPGLIWLLVWSIRKRVWSADGFKRALVPAALMLMMGAAWMLYYNWRGTGNPLLMPYVVNERTYHITKPFLWQTRNPIPDYNHLVMRTFYCFHELPEYIVTRHWWGVEQQTKNKFNVYYQFFLWPVLLLFLPALLRMFRSRRARLVAVTTLVTLAGLLVESWIPHGHYAAPIECVVIAIVLYGMRLLRTWQPRQLPVGRALVRAVVVVVLAWSTLPLADHILDPMEREDFVLVGAAVERARLQAQLERMPGQHLVIVHQRRGYNGSADWIYNEPDIDRAKIVWARDMGTERNQELLRYFPNRQVWIVDQNDGIIRLTAYNGHSSEDTLASAVGLQAEPKSSR